MKKQIKQTVLLIFTGLIVSSPFCFGNYEPEPLATVTVQINPEDLTLAISDGMDDYAPSDYPNKPTYSFNLCVENSKTGEKECKVVQTSKK